MPGIAENLRAAAQRAASSVQDISARSVRDVSYAAQSAMSSLRGVEHSSRAAAAAIMRIPAPKIDTKSLDKLEKKLTRLAEQKHKISLDTGDVEKADKGISRILRSYAGFTKRTTLAAVDTTKNWARRGKSVLGFMTREHKSLLAIASVSALVANKYRMGVIKSGDEAGKSMADMAVKVTSTAASWTGMAGQLLEVKEAISGYMEMIPWLGKFVAGVTAGGSALGAFWGAASSASLGILNLTKKNLITGFLWDKIAGKMFEATRYFKESVLSTWEAGTYMEKAIRKTQEAVVETSDYLLNLGKELPKAGAGTLAMLGKHHKMFAYAFNQAIGIAAKFGKSIEEVKTLVRDIPIKLRFEGESPEEAGKRIAEATEDILTYAKILRVDPSRALDYITMKAYKFGYGAKEASKVAREDFQKVHLVVTKLNATFGEGTVRADEFSADLMELAESSPRYAQNIGMLASTVGTMQAKMKAAGATHEEARKIALNTMKALSDKEGEFTHKAAVTLMQEYTNAPGEFMKKIKSEGVPEQVGAEIEGLFQKAATGKIDRYMAGKIILEKMGETEAGMGHVFNTMMDYMRRGGQNYAVIGEMMGLSWGETYTLVEKTLKKGDKLGKETFEDLTRLGKEAMEEIAGLTQGVASSPEKLLKKTAAALLTLEGPMKTVGQALLASGGDVQKVSQETIAQISKSLGITTEETKELLEGIVEASKSGAGNVGEVLKKAGGALKEVKGPMEKAGDSLLATEESLRKRAINLAEEQRKVAAQMARTEGGLVGGLLSLTDALRTLHPFLGEKWEERIAKIEGAIVKFKEWWQEHTSSISVLWAGAGAKLGMTVLGLFLAKRFGLSLITMIPGIAKTALAVGSAFLKGGSLWKAVLTEAPKNLPIIGKMISGLSTGFIGRIASGLGSALGRIKSISLFSKIAGSMGRLASPFALLQVGSSLPALIKTLGKQSSPEAWKELGHASGQTVGTIIGGIFGGPLGAFLGGEIGSAAGILIAEHWEKISAKMSGVLEFFKDPISNTWKLLGKFWDEAVTWPGRVTNFFSNMFKKEEITATAVETGKTVGEIIADTLWDKLSKNTGLANLTKFLVALPAMLGLLKKGGGMAAKGGGKILGKILGGPEPEEEVAEARAKIGERILATIKKNQEAKQQAAQEKKQQAESAKKAAEEAADIAKSWKETAERKAAELPVGAAPTPEVEEAAEHATLVSEKAAELGKIASEKAQEAMQAAQEEEEAKENEHKQYIAGVEQTVKDSKQKTESAKQEAEDAKKWETAAKKKADKLAKAAEYDSSFIKEAEEAAKQAEEMSKIAKEKAKYAKVTASAAKEDTRNANIVLREEARRERAAKRGRFGKFMRAGAGRLAGAGGVLGMALSSAQLTGAVSGMFSAKTPEEKSEARKAIGGAIGATAGTVIGTFLGGPVGALIGGVIGEKAGTFIGEKYGEGIGGFFTDLIKGFQIFWLSLKKDWYRLISKLPRWLTGGYGEKAEIELAAAPALAWESKTDTEIALEKYTKRRGAEGVAGIQEKVFGREAKMAEETLGGRWLRDQRLSGGEAAKYIIAMQQLGKTDAEIEKYLKDNYGLLSSFSQSLIKQVLTLSEIEDRASQEDKEAFKKLQDILALPETPEAEKPITTEKQPASEAEKAAKIQEKNAKEIEATKKEAKTKKEATATTITKKEQPSSVAEKVVESAAEKAVTKKEQPPSTAEKAVKSEKKTAEERAVMRESERAIRASEGTTEAIAGIQKAQEEKDRRTRVITPEAGLTPIQVGGGVKGRRGPATAKLGETSSLAEPVKLPLKMTEMDTLTGMAKWEFEMPVGDIYDALVKAGNIMTPAHRTAT